MERKERPFDREPPHVAPLGAAYRATYQQDHEPEVANPLQLSLLPAPQPDMFVEQNVPQPVSVSKQG